MIATEVVSRVTPKVCLGEMLAVVVVVVEWWFLAPTSRKPTLDLHPEKKNPLIYDFARNSFCCPRRQFQMCWMSFCSVIFFTVVFFTSSHIYNFCVYLKDGVLMIFFSFLLYSTFFLLSVLLFLLSVLLFFSFSTFFYLFLLILFSLLFYYLYLFTFLLLFFLVWLIANLHQSVKVE